MEKSAFLCICVSYILVFFIIPGEANHHSYNGDNNLMQQQGHHARHEHHSGGLTHSSNSLHNNGIVCYTCNSAFDPRCGDPFDPYSLGTVNCSMRPSPEHLQKIPPTLCRKTVQKVYGKIRVIRGCGYLTDEERDDKACARRSGTHDVQVFYCSCTGSLCNQSSVLQSQLNMITLIGIFLTIYYTSTKRLQCILL